MASPVNDSLVGYDVYSNILTFTPYLKLGREYPISEPLILLSPSAAFFG